MRYFMILCMLCFSTALKADERDDLRLLIQMHGSSAEITKTAHLPDRLLPSRDFLDRTHELDIEGCTLTSTITPVWAVDGLFVSQTRVDLTYLDLNTLITESDSKPYFYITSDSFRQNNRADFTFKVQDPILAQTSYRQMAKSYKLPLSEQRKTLKAAPLESKLSEKMRISIYSLEDETKPMALFQALKTYQSAYCR